MRALEILKRDRDISLSICNDKSIISAYNEAIKELEELQENKLLVKMNQEMIKLRTQNQDLLNTIIEAQKAIENILERNK